MEDDSPPPVPTKRRTPPLKPELTDAVTERPGSDPDGVAPAHQAAKDEPKALPNSDRHHMETAVAKAR